MQGSNKFQSSNDGRTHGKQQITVSRVASTILQLGDRNGSKLSDIRKAIASKTGLQPTFLQLKTIVRRGLREGALKTSSENRFMTLISMAKRSVQDLSDRYKNEKHSALPKLRVVDRSNQASCSATTSTALLTSSCSEEDAFSLSVSKPITFQNCDSSSIILKGEKQFNIKETTSKEIAVTTSVELLHKNDIPKEILPQAKLSERLNRNFYSFLANNLHGSSGKRIVRMVDGIRIAARIVETEAYLGAVDKAAHSYKGEGAAVLIRSVEPVEGMEKMLELRGSKSSSKKTLKARDLGNGPSKLCQSLAITKASINQRDLVTDDCIWIEADEPIPEEQVVVTARH
ncbi:hypothetical protein C0Q70_01557 [Pomacea canaliculata]|uniref:DNA-3-methyladenine glycosylase II n=1 Tax=Pomacea canaliculata TaxID=400727 RepID=A0A2T7PZT7_POMCA|nr:hypothetical protein C0Q70_01557 [Pomacea canaliculata]